VLAALLLKIGSYCLYRYMYSLGDDMFIHITVTLWASCGYVVASLICCYQVDIKLIIAYSSVSHISILLIVLLVDSRSVTSISIVFILLHACTSGCMFLLASELSVHSTTRALLLTRSVMYRLFTTGLLLLLLLALNFGMPPFIGFLVEIISYYSMLTYLSVVIVMCVLVVVYSRLFRLVMLRVLLNGSSALISIELSYRSPMSTYSLSSVLLLIVMLLDWVT